MRKLFLMIVIGVSMFMVGDGFNLEVLQDCFSQSCKIEYIIDGESEYAFVGDDNYVKILNCFNDMIEASHQMPAIGVSIHELAVEGKQQGTWLEFNFDKTYYFNEMPFEALLIEIVPNFGGFNLIRRVDGRYDGRCLYLNLNDKNMHELYELLHAI